MGRFLDDSWMRAGHQKDQVMIRNLEFSAPPLPPPFSCVGRWSENGVDDQSCLRDEASIKIPKVQGLESFWVGDQVEVLGEWRAASHIPCAMHPFHLDAHLYPLTSWMKVRV